MNVTLSARVSPVIVVTSSLSLLNTIHPATLLSISLTVSNEIAVRSCLINIEQHSLRDDRRAEVRPIVEDLPTIDYELSDYVHVSKVS